jgi:DNA-binding MarR family transcriptional regulator
MVQLTFEDCVGAHSPGRLLRAINSQMLAFAEARFADAELSFVQWIALKVVYDGTVRTAGELSRNLKMTTGSITRLVDGLERKDLLVRDRSGSDRRVVALAITAAGTAKIYEFAPTLSQAWNDVLADFDEGEFVGLTIGLKKLLAAFERNSTDRTDLQGDQAPVTPSEPRRAQN